MTGSDRTPPSHALNPDDAIVVLEQASLATEAGVPLAPGLRAMAEESRGKQRQALLDLADRLDQGESLPSILETLQPRLSPLMRTLIEQGGQFGRADTVLHWAAEQGRRRRELFRKLWFSVAYPIFLLSVAAVIGLFVMIMIVPSFGSIFENFGTELPPLTIAIVSTGRFLAMCAGFVQKYFVLTGPVIVLAFIGLAIWIRSGSKWLVSRRWSVLVPVVGPLFRLETLSAFCHLLAIFIEIRLPLHRAVRMAGLATGDIWLREASTILATDIEEGEPSHVSGMSLGIPVAISQILNESNSPEALIEALHGLGDLYAMRASVNSRFVSIVFEPFILIVTTLGLGTVITALYMPLIKLLNYLS